MLFSLITGNKLKIIFFIIIIAILISGFFYVRYLQTSILSLRQENARLISTIEESNRIINFLREDISRQQKLLQQSRDNIRRIERERADLEKRLREIDISALARVNPAKAREEIKKELDAIFTRLENSTR